MRRGLSLLLPFLLLDCSSPAAPESHDLAFSFLDFAVGNTGCRGLVVCILEQACQDRACVNRCRAKALQSARDLYNQALTCGQSYCLQPSDAGAAPCVLSGNTLVDAQPGSNLCNECLYNGLAGLFGLPCIPAASPDCNPPSCQPLFTECGASRP